MRMQERCHVTAGTGVWWRGPDGFCLPPCNAAGLSCASDDRAALARWCGERDGVASAVAVAVGEPLYNGTGTSVEAARRKAVRARPARCSGLPTA